MKGKKSEEISFHKRALVTLMAERRELVRMLKAINNLISAHIRCLEDLGINFKKEVKLEIKR